MKDVKRYTRPIRTRGLIISSPTLSPLDQRLQLLNQWKIFAIYALTLLMYTVTSPEPDPNSKLTSAMREETLTPNPNKCNEWN